MSGGDDRGVGDGDGITNLVLPERAANQLYPDAVGDAKLLDPQRVADSVVGDV